MPNRRSYPPIITGSNRTNITIFLWKCRLHTRRGNQGSTFRNCALFTSPDRYHTEDLIQGRVGKTDFCCAEIHAEERKTRVNSKGQTSHYWVDIFKGFFFIADFQKDFQGHTTILRNSLFKLSSSGSRVKLENPDFEKTFECLLYRPDWSTLPSFSFNDGTTSCTRQRIQ